MLLTPHRLLRAACVGVALFLVVMPSTGCGNDMLLEYHVIQPGRDAISQVANMCRTGEQKRFTYRFPAGNSVEVMASTAAAFSVSIGPDANVRLIKAPPVGEGGVELVTVAVIPLRPDIADAAEHRRRLEWCDLLIVNGGKAIGVVYGGTGQWEGSIPGGTFDSYEAAERVYLAYVDNLDRDVLDSASIESDAEWSKWLVLRDAWAFHCHPETQAAIQAGDPALFTKLMALSIPDCTKEPQEPN